MSKLQTLKVNESANGLRLDNYLTEQFTGKSRSYWQKLIATSHIRINDAIVSKAGVRLNAGDVIAIAELEQSKAPITAQNIPLNILYEDKYLLVVNKQPGIPVHPASGHPDGTLVNALLHHLPGQLSTFGGYERPGIVHRLDKDTSGLLVVAKNDDIHSALSTQFADKTAGRIYNALVWQVPKEGSGVIETNFDRHPRDRKKMAVRQNGKVAITRYKIQKEYGFCTLVELQLGTGRTHQIRVHMSHMGHPVVGDDTYGGDKTRLNSIPVMDRKFAGHLLKAIPYHLLHARTLTFQHPHTMQIMAFTSPLPVYFRDALTKLDEREKKMRR
jgi:23S rRNA pseudouridine1911/1915/1917 synthase